jgi:putative FmdB family regulatory protein
MPLYEYRCTQCFRRVEIIQKVGGPPLEKCQVCGGAMKKVISSPAIQFKGTGWYITDYARKSGGGESATEKKEKKEESAAKESKDSSSSGSSTTSATSSGASTDKK